MSYVTIICVHAWRYDRTGDATGDPSGKSQTYSDPEHDIIDGWAVYTCHRDPETDDLVDPENAFDFDQDFTLYDSARAVADRLSADKGWEVREY